MPVMSRDPWLNLFVCALLSASLSASAAACAERLPAGEAYRTHCLRMNPEPIAPYDGDPHEGWKDVWACDVTEADLLDADGDVRLPYPDGTLIVKESCALAPCDDDGSYAWLIATARKTAGTWTWAEYTRNFADEDFAKLPLDEAVCTDCHQKYETLDWISTLYDPAD